MITGGWSPFETNITGNEMEVFKEATDSLLGVEYQPIAVSTQVVNGMNYNYFCNATPSTQEPVTYSAMVKIYQQPNHRPIITEIHRVI